MIVQGASCCILVALVCLGMSKIPKWVSYILAVPLAVLLWLAITIEFAIIKAWFKYEMPLNLNRHLSKEEIAERTKWLDENIGSKNYCTTQCTAENKKPSVNDLLDLYAYIRFRTADQMIHYKLSWFEPENNDAEN